MILLQDPSIRDVTVTMEIKLATHFFNCRHIFTRRTRASFTILEKKLFLKGSLDGYTYIWLKFLKGVLLRAFTERKPPCCWPQYRFFKRDSETHLTVPPHTTRDPHHQNPRSLLGHLNFHLMLIIYWFSFQKR